MKVKIEFKPNTASKMEFAEQVKNIAKDLIATCSRYGVTELTYVHDYFKIHIEQPEMIIQQDITPLFKCEDKGE